MTVPSLYSAKAFYDSTSALSGNPFVNNSTCGVSGTLRSCGLAAFPGGNIGYANRIEGVSGFFDDFLGGAKTVAQNVLGFVAPSVGSAVEQLIGQGRKLALEKAGYKFLEVVQVTVQGKPIAGTKVKKPDNTFVVMLADGTEIPYTSDVAKQTLVVDPKTGFTTGQTAGIAVAAIAAVALLYFITKRR